MSNCTKNNPCSCKGTPNFGPTSLCGGCPPGSPTPCPPKCKTPGTCLEICSPIINADDAVGPCGQFGTADLTTYKSNTEVCEDNPLTYSYVSHDAGVFASADVSTSGIVTWSTLGPETCGEYGEITFKVCCGKFSILECITIGIKNECECPTCNSCEECDPCTGDCIEAAGEIMISEPQGGKISIK